MIHSLWRTVQLACIIVGVAVCTQILDQADFLELCSHILRGDQLIVRGSDVSTVTSVLNVLKVHLWWGEGRDGGWG